MTAPEETLARGRRHVLVKPDGAVVVHDETGHRPRVTQPSAPRRTVEATETEVVLTATHSGTTLVVSFVSIQYLGVAGDTPATPAATEAALRTLVLETPSVIEPGFQPLATERQTSAGPVDIYGEDAAGRTVVLELKRQRAGPAAVSQLGRYVSALREELHADATVRGILVAPSVTDRAHRQLARDGLEFVACSPTQDSP